MTSITLEEYHKLKEQNKSYFILAIILFFLFFPAGVVFLVLALSNYDKIQEFEKTHPELTQSQYQPVQNEPDSPPLLENPQKIPHNCPYCGDPLDNESRTVLRSKNFIFCSNCGARIDK